MGPLESHGKPWFKRIFQKTPSYTHCISTSDLNKTPIPRSSAIRSISLQVKTLMLPPRQLKGGKSVKLRSQMGLVQPLFSRAKRSKRVDTALIRLILCWCYVDAVLRPSFKPLLEPQRKCLKLRVTVCREI
jgi:hypothetical protein